MLNEKSAHDTGQVRNSTMVVMADRFAIEHETLQVDRAIK